MSRALEARTGFFIVTGPNPGSIKRQIGEQSGLRPDAVSVDELATFYDQVSRNDLSATPVMKKYAGQSSSRARYETRQQVCQRAELLVAPSDSYTYLSYGLFAPSYQEGLRLQRDTLGSVETPHKALLLGAASVDTIREYAATVKDVYPGAECNVVDIQAYKTNQISSDIASFTFGSALDLPFPSGSFDSIHTNFLLGSLVDPQNKERSKREMRQALFGEVNKALNDNGAFFMLENSDEVDDVAHDLIQAGFGTVRRGMAQFFDTRREMEMFFRGTGENPLPDTVLYTPEISLIMAEKRGNEEGR